jgi:hypothetical protein
VAVAAAWTVGVTAGSLVTVGAIVEAGVAVAAIAVAVAGDVGAGVQANRVKTNSRMIKMRCLVGKVEQAFVPHMETLPASICIDLTLIFLIRYSLIETRSRCRG